MFKRLVKPTQNENVILSKNQGTMQVTRKRRVGEAFGERAAAARRRRVKAPRTLGLAPARTGGFFGVGVRRSRDERKVIDVDPALYAGDTTGSVTLLNGVATGTDFTDRIGRKIVMRSLYLRGTLSPVDGITLDNMCRVLIVYDMQSNGAAPAITDVLKSATSIAQLNMNNRDRFRVIMDKQFAVGLS